MSDLTDLLEQWCECDTGFEEGELVARVIKLVRVEERVLTDAWRDAANECWDEIQCVDVASCGQGTRAESMMNAARNRDVLMGIQVGL